VYDQMSSREGEQFADDFAVQDLKKNDRKD
jgi:hypothetical protein